jgi:hypothetical protein
MSGRSPAIFFMITMLLCGCKDEPGIPKEGTIIQDTSSRHSDTIPFTGKYTSKILYKDTFVTGRFDKRKGLDTAQLMVPMKEFEMFGCRPCSTRVVFSNGSDSLCFPEGDVGGGLANIGDLDRDGDDEILYYNAQFVGCWADLRLYSRNDSGWQKIGSIAYYACSDTIGILNRVKRVSKDSIVMIGDNYEGEKNEERFEFKRAR